MALRASLREIRLHVVWIRRAPEILQVTADARRVRARQVVIAIHVTLRALQAGVRTGQRESGGVVIESGARPGSGGMALLASLREAGLHVIRIGRALEILQVAADARRVRARQVVISVHVTLRALQAGVRTGQRESGGVVIESRARPGSGGVALLASLREAGLHVIRIGGSLEILQVAADAGGVGAGQIVVAIHVALGALHARVGASQRESGGVVIESGARPGSGRVALLASLREA